MAKKKNTYSLILVLIVISFMGFCVENIFTALTHGFINNKNMILPFLWGYGLALLALYKLFGTPSNPLCFGSQISFSSKAKGNLYYFCVAFIGVCIGEILLGYAVEIICNVIWWDYSMIPLHITKYTSIPTSLGFALIIFLFMRYAFEQLLNRFSALNIKVLKTVSITHAVLLSIDMLNSGLYMLINQNFLSIWRVDFPKSLLHIIMELIS